ncbi:hypothetical protein OSTOST_24443, partial [Ostertagia ostertagi]
MVSTNGALQIFQYTNTVVATISTLLIHGYIIHRIKSNRASLTHYQNFLIAQSVIYICGSVLTIVINERFTLDNERQTGYPFIVVPMWLTTVIMVLSVMVQTAESILLTLFNVHRLLLFIRPKKSKLFFILISPVAFSSTAFTGVAIVVFKVRPFIHSKLNK